MKEIENKPYMGMMTRNFVAKNDTQDAKFDLLLMFGNDYKAYTIDTYNKTIVEIQDNKKEKTEDIQKIKNRRFTRNQKQIAVKINELIDAVNEIRNRE